MPARDFVILGCGFTGRRVARFLLDQGEQVLVTSRTPEALADLQRLGADAVQLDVADRKSIDSLCQRISSGSRVLLSIPPVEGLTDSTQLLLQELANRPSRLVYLSTTGVYGAAAVVDAMTPAAPLTQTALTRVLAERAVMGTGARSLILRPAAIYGPGRGVHASMRAGTFRLAGAGDNYVSRIHVDDLAVHAEAALRSDIIGAYPVADEEPCRSREIAHFCAELLGVPMAPESSPAELHSSRGADRRVDGSAIRRLLGVSLKYGSYKTGIPASIAEEKNAGLE